MLKLVSDATLHPVRAINEHHVNYGNRIGNSGLCDSDQQRLDVRELMRGCTNLERLDGIVLHIPVISDPAPALAPLDVHSQLRPELI